MAHYFAADVHLRLDQQVRSERFARWVDRIGSTDPLTIVGDLCDFWFASRQVRSNPMTCAGLSALRRYADRGGSLSILAGNHDAWLGPFYEQNLGATFYPNTLDLTVGPTRIHLAHGHRLGGVGTLKKAMESHAFLTSFGLLPAPIANLLESKLDKSNASHRKRDDRRQFDGFRTYAEARTHQADLILIGHLHQTIDTQVGTARLIIPGSWHVESCFVRVDEQGATLVVEKD